MANLIDPRLMQMGGMGSMGGPKPAAGISQLLQQGIAGGGVPYANMVGGGMNAPGSNEDGYGGHGNEQPNEDPYQGPPGRTDQWNWWAGGGAPFEFGFGPELTDLFNQWGGDYQTNLWNSLGGLFSDLFRNPDESLVDWGNPNWRSDIYNIFGFQSGWEEGLPGPVTMDQIMALRDLGYLPPEVMGPINDIYTQIYGSGEMSAGGGGGGGGQPPWQPGGSIGDRWQTPMTEWLMRLIRNRMRGPFGIPENVLDRERASLTTAAATRDQTAQRQLSAQLNTSGNLYSGRGNTVRSDLSEGISSLLFDALNNLNSEASRLAIQDRQSVMQNALMLEQMMQSGRLGWDANRIQELLGGGQLNLMNSQWLFNSSMMSWLYDWFLSQGMNPG